MDTAPLVQSLESYPAILRAVVGPVSDDDARWRGNRFDLRLETIHRGPESQPQVVLFFAGQDCRQWTE